MSIAYETRQAIASLPGKTVERWKDGDKPCHCTHCDLCGVLYRTDDIGTHEAECQAALLAVIVRARDVAALDSWATEPNAYSVGTFEFDEADDEKRSFVDLAKDGSIVKRCYGADPDEARKAASEAIQKGDVS